MEPRTDFLESMNVGSSCWFGRFTVRSSFFICPLSTSCVLTVVFPLFLAVSERASAVR